MFSPLPRRAVFLEIWCDEAAGRIFKTLRGLSHVALMKPGVPGGDDSRVTDDEADVSSMARVEGRSLTFSGTAPIAFGEVPNAPGKGVSK